MVNKEKLGEPVGFGTEKKVYQDSVNKDKVIGVFREHIKETPYQIKARFYLTKILHLLFPKNIPDMHWAGSEPNAYQADRIEPDQNHKALMDYSDEHRFPPQISAEEKAELEEKRKHAFRSIREDKEVKDFIKKIMSLGIYIDSAPGNFSKDLEGNVLYLDSFSAWTDSSDLNLLWLCDLDKLEASLRSLPETERTKAKSYLVRIKTLFEEEKKGLSAKGS